jgi:hypothetical protein
MSAAYVAYFDASGHSNRQKVVTVAGFVSTVKKRARFDIEWNAFLENEGIDIFHMTDFASSQRQFAGWKGQSDRRRVFIEQLVQCVRKNVNKAFRTSLLIDDFNEVNRIFRLEETIGRPTDAHMPSAGGSASIRFAFGPSERMLKANSAAISKMATRIRETLKRMRKRGARSSPCSCRKKGRLRFRHVTLLAGSTELLSLTH